MSIILMIKEDSKGSKLLGIYSSINLFSTALTRLSNQKDIIMKEIPIDMPPRENGLTLKDLNFSADMDYAIVIEN